MISRDFDANYGQYIFGFSSSTNIKIKIISDSTEEWRLNFSKF